MLDATGIPVVFFGIISTANFLIKIPGNLFAYKIKEKFKIETVLTFIILINAIGYISIFYLKNIFCIIPIMCIFLSAGIIEPLVSGILHRNTQSEVRAATESFFSFGLRVVSTVIGLVFGYLSTKHGIFSGFGFIGVICLVYMILYRFFIKKVNVKSI